jgi:hypothetical protein
MPKLPNIAKIGTQGRKLLLLIAHTCLVRTAHGFAFQLSRFGNFGIFGNLLHDPVLLT